MPRGALAVIVAGTLAVIAGGGLALAGDERDLAFANGVAPLDAVLVLEPGRRACQSAIPVVEPFAGVRLAADTGGRPGPALELTVRESGGGATRAAIAGGYLARRDAPASGPQARLAAVVERGPVEVCVDNRGTAPLALVGARGGERGQGDLRVGRPDDLRDARGALSLAFLRERPTTLLAQLPVAFERAALFHPPLVGAWAFWVLTVLVLLGLPALIASAVRDASAPERRAGG